jgi:hypothetical protein
MKRITLGLIPFSILLSGLSATYSAAAAAATNLYFDVRFDLASHEVVRTTNGTKLVVRRITNLDIIAGLSGYSYLPGTNLASARLLERLTPDNNLAMIVRNGTNEYDVSQNFNITWPQSAYYHGILAESTTSSGAHRQVTQRIMQLICAPAHSFNVQGFATETYITNHGHFYSSVVAKVAGGGNPISRDGIQRDGVIEGTIRISGPLAPGSLPFPLLFQQPPALFPPPIPSLR